MDKPGELEAACVCSRDAEGRLFSRRMVKDEGVREARAAGGAAGAEHGIKGASHGSKGLSTQNKDGLKGDEKTPLKPPFRFQTNFFFFFNFGLFRSYRNGRRLRQAATVGG